MVSHVSVDHARGRRDGATISMERQNIVRSERSQWRKYGHDAPNGDGPSNVMLVALVAPTISDLPSGTRASTSSILIPQGALPLNTIVNAYPVTNTALGGDLRY